VLSLAQKMQGERKDFLDAGTDTAAHHQQSAMSTRLRAIY